MVLYPDVFNYDFDHEINPAYIKDFYNLGSPYKTNLKSGELFVFNPEILHATSLNTGNKTRVVFSGNILRQPMCANIDKRVRKEGYPNSDNVMERGVLLPVHHGMTDSMYIRLHETIRQFIESKV